MATTNGQQSRPPRLARSQEAYDKFAQADEVPLMVVTILWLPVLIVPLVRPVHGSVAQTLAVIDYMVWALFALEYVVKLYSVTQSRRSLSSSLRPEIRISSECRC